MEDEEDEEEEEEEASLKEADEAMESVSPSSSTMALPRISSTQEALCRCRRSTAANVCRG